MGRNISYGILYKVIDFQSALSIVLKIRFYVVFYGATNGRNYWWSLVVLVLAMPVVQAQGDNDACIDQGKGMLP